MAVSEGLAADAGPPGSKDSAKPDAPAYPRPIPVRVSLPRTKAPVPCKAGPACKRLLRKNAERDRRQAVRVGDTEENCDDVSDSDVPLEKYCGGSSDSARSKLNSGASGPHLPPHKKRRRAVWLEDLDDISDTPLEEYNDCVPENQACRPPSFGTVTQTKATVRAPRPINKPKVKSSAGGKELNEGQQCLLNKNEKKNFLEPSMSARPEAANAELAKNTSNATVEPQSSGTKVCAVTTVKPNNKSSLALATGKDKIEKKVLKRLGTPCKNEDAKKVKSDPGTAKSMAESCVSTGKKSSSQSPAVKVSPNNKLQKSLVCHAKSTSKMHTSTSDNRCATKHAPGPKLKDGTTPAKAEAANDGICRAKEDSSLSAAKKVLPDKLAKKPESFARGSSDVSAKNLSVSAKQLPATTQKTTNDRPETKNAGSVTCHHNAAGSSAKKNTLPNRLVQKPQPCTKNSCASSQSNSTQVVPSATAKTAKDAAQAKAGCIPDMTRQSVNSSVIKKVLPKIPKKPISSDMSAKSDVSTSKKETLAKAPTSTLKIVKNMAERKVGRSSGTDLQTTGPPVSKQAPSQNSLDTSVSKPPSPVSIPKKLLDFTSNADKGAVPSIPAKKSALSVNSSNASKVFALEKVDKTQSDLKTEHKKCSDGHSATLLKGRAADNAANHSIETADSSSKVHEATNGMQVKSTAVSACATTVEVKISRSKLTGCPDALTSPSKLFNSAESLLSEQGKQQLSKLPERMPSSDQTDCSVRSFPESGTCLSKAFNVKLPHGGHQALTVPETTIQAEATVPATSESPQRATGTPPDETACLQQEAQASGQPAKNVIDSVSETVLSSNGLHTHEKTGTSRDVCTSKTQEPMTEVRELVADVIVQVINNLADLADIGAEVECSDDCIHENSAIVYQGDRARLPQDSSNVTDRSATSTESNAVGTNSPKLPTDATEHAPLEQNVENASEMVNKDATVLPRKLDDKDRVAAVTLSPEQANSPSVEKRCSVSLAKRAAAATGDCDRASNVLPKNHCLQDSTDEEDPGVAYNDVSTRAPHEHSHQEPQILSSRRPGSDATTIAKEIRDSESCAMREGIRQEKEKTAGSQKLAASEVANEAVRSSDTSMCASNNERNCQQEPENTNCLLPEVHTDNTALSIAQNSVGGEVPDESSEQQAEELSAGVAQYTEAEDTVEPMHIDNYVHNESSRAHSLVDKLIDLPKGLKKSSDIVPGSSNGICDEGSSTETSDTLSLLSENSVEDASQPVIAVANAPKPSGHSKKKRRKRSAGTNTSLCSAWVFSRNKRGKRKHRDSQHSSSGGEENSSSNSISASVLTEAATANTSAVADDLTRDIYILEAALKIKEEPSGVNACGDNMLVSSDEKNSSSTSISASASNAAATANSSAVADVLTRDIYILEAALKIKKEPSGVNTCGDNMLVSSDARRAPCASTVHMGSAAKDPNTAAYKSPLAPVPAAPQAKISSFVHGALLDLDMFTGLSILDICGSDGTTGLKDLKARIVNHTITKNDAVAEIARSVRTAVVEEYFKGERAIKTLQLLSKIPFSLEPTKVHKIRKLTQAVLGKSEPFTKLQL